MISKLHVMVFFIPLICNGDIKLKIEGLDNELNFNVYKHLSDINTHVSYIDMDFKKKIDNAIRSGLRPFGYYSPTLCFYLYTPINKESNLLVVKVEPGSPIIITDVNVVVRGDGAKDIDYQQVIEYGRSFIGKQLKHSDYDQFKSKLYSLALFKGYFDAKFQNSQLIVIPSCYQSIWNIDFYSGQRYLLEEIKFKGSQIKEDYLKNISNTCLGKYYNAKSIIDLKSSLHSTNWFDSISISPGYTCFQKKS